MLGYSVHVCAGDRLEARDMPWFVSCAGSAWRLEKASLLVWTYKWL